MLFGLKSILFIMIIVKNFQGKFKQRIISVHSQNFMIVFESGNLIRVGPNLIPNAIKQPNHNFRLNIGLILSCLSKFWPHDGFVS